MAPHTYFTRNWLQIMPFKECVENSWAIKGFACAGNSRDLNGKRCRFFKKSVACLQIFY